MALFLEQTLKANLTWVIFEPNDEPLWVAIRVSIESFMLSLFHQGAFTGTTPSRFLQVKCDSSTTTQDDVNNGESTSLWRCPVQAGGIRDCQDRPTGRSGSVAFGGKLMGKPFYR